MTSQDHYRLGSLVQDRPKRHLLRRARTAASLPGRVVASEDRTNAIEQHVVRKIDEMRAELAELRLMVQAQLDADAESTELIGRLLQAYDARVGALEQEILVFAQKAIAPQEILGSGSAPDSSTARA
ncbi:MAG TPA: hypothetical protein VNE42_05550 [Acidimicrobiales bacterium]|nr:hypothetical protein [Acidimicrobiales bacterium]